MTAGVCLSACLSALTLYYYCLDTVNMLYCKSKSQYAGKLASWLRSVLTKCFSSFQFVEQLNFYRVCHQKTVQSVSTNHPGISISMFT